MITSPKVVLKTRSWSPLAARAWTILNSWRWNSRFASGFTASVRPAVTPVMTRATASTGRNRRNALKAAGDRKSTRLNSSHGYISYAVFCLKKKKKELGRAHGADAQNRYGWHRLPGYAQSS